MDEIIEELRRRMADTDFDYITLTKSEVVTLIKDIEEAVQQIHWNIEG